MERLLRHEEEDLLFKGKNIHCRKMPLFKGLGDSLVYSGYLKKTKDSKEEEIAVRKIKVTDCCDKWNDIFNKHTREKDFIKHENVLRIVSYEEMDEWRYFALERYDATLEQFCKGIYRGPMPSDAQVLCQITKGLLFLHKEQCTHGNLTPRTVLIASAQPVRMMIKLSEFGLSKFGDQCDEKLGKQHELCKKKYWILDYIIDYIAESYFFRNFPFFSRLVNNWKNSRQPLGDRQCDEETGKQQEFCLRKYWILNGTPTPNQDIFSAGCVSFYFLKRGVHPFGDDSSSILENIKQRNPVNLLKTEQQDEDIWEFAYDPIKNMIGDPPTDGTNWLMIAKDNFKKALPLRFEEKEENELGRGGYGKVYKGTFEGNAVAVKVTVKDHLDDARKKEQKREMEEHLRLDHENVLKLLHVDELRDKTCLVLELCAGTLTNYCEKKYNGPELPPDGQVLYQIANGLQYIHSRNLVHRDVKPDNILISITTPVQMKLSDFGLVKKTSPQGTCTQRSQLNGLKGTPYWTIAPENFEFSDKVIKSKRNNTFLELPHGTIKSDIWAAGLVFFYFLTRGSHPYGRFEILEGFEISANIEKNNPIELIKHIKNLQGDDLGLYELIGKMIKPKEERISLPEVIEQLTTKLNASRQFKKFERSMSGIDEFYCHFHPTEPVLACTGVNKVILLSADNSSIPFSNWKEKETKLELAHFEYTATMEWNADGTQLAAIAHTEGDFNAHSPHTDHNIIVWNYPSGKILFQKKLNEPMYQIKWNPFRPNVFATSGGKLGSKRVVFFFNSCPVDQRSFHFYTIESDHTSFQWISENRFASRFFLGTGIEIWEIDESTAIANVVKRFQHEKGRIFDMAWDERTKCLAACSSNGWIKIWSMDSDQPIHALQMKDVQCRSLVWRPNGKQMDDEGVDAARKSAYNFILACGLFDGRIVIWTPLLEEKKQRIRSQHSHLVSSLSFSPDGRFLAAADTNWKLGIWATEDWEPVYIGKGEWGDHLSWLFSSMDVPNYKLTFNTCSDKVRVVEYAVGQAKQRSKNRPH